MRRGKLGKSFGSVSIPEMGQRGVFGIDLNPSSNRFLVNKNLIFQRLKFNHPCLNGSDCMVFAELFRGRRRVAIFATLIFGTFIILLPTTVKMVSNAFLVGGGHDVQIDTVSYVSNQGPEGRSLLIVGNLYHPMFNLSKKCPAIIACHGFVGGIGKETISRWCIELAKRDYVVLSIDQVGHGSTLGPNMIFPCNDTEPNYIQDGIAYLKTLSFVDPSAIGLLGHSFGGRTVCLAAGVLG